MKKRILAVDLGTKRVGLAITDPMNIIAQRLKTVTFKNRGSLASELLKVINEMNVGTVVFGVPVTLSGKESVKTVETLELINYIKKKLPDDILIETEDEALTTVDAHEVMHQMGLKPSRNKDIVDQIAAQHILRAYMDKTG